MQSRTRRQFLGEVGRGMVIAGVGASVASDLGLCSAFGEEGAGRIALGQWRPLVDLLQQTPLDKLQTVLVAKLQSGEANVGQLVAAGALANAETFGGEDYVGFHTAMAMRPALEMSSQMPKGREALPVLKVLYQNTHQIQNSGGAKKRTLKPTEAASTAQASGQALRDAGRKPDVREAERIFAALASQPYEQAYNDLHDMVQDDTDVHRFVLAHRAYRLIDVVGPDFAHTMLRQCVRYCCDSEQERLSRNRPEPEVRSLLPKLMDQYGLVAKKLGSREADDAWMLRMSETIYRSNSKQAAEAVAEALAEGMAPEAVGEAISLAANALVLRQPDDGKRIHGASTGVHASDAMNAWRNMARVVDDRHAAAGLILAAYYTVRNTFPTDPLPAEADRELVKATDPQKLLAEAEEAIRDNDQSRAAAAIAIYGEEGHPVRPVFDLMLRYTVSEDGRLHGEKYYQTVTEEFATTRPALRWRHVVGLARVTASAYGFSRDDKPGFRAPGYEEACRLLNV
ncbi:MAG: hypothetical protein KY475_21260 [Planctomycetes bacterium]|nr:hypothetical protein [Planctomycetota bacterium]